MRVHDKSTELWEAHVDASLAWLRVHDAGVRALPSLEKDRLLGVGVLVEPRDHANAEFVLRNWAHFRARQGWGLVVVHGSTRTSKDFYAQLTRGWPNVRLLDCGAEDLRDSAYNDKLREPAFWRPLLPFDRVVILQTDTAQISAASLASFCAFDWVGAPWANACFVCGSAILPSTAAEKSGALPPQPCCGHMIDHVALQSLAPNLVGNGGLSLRNPRAMLEVCERFRVAASAPHKASTDTRTILNATNEDTFFCLGLAALGKRIAPRAVAAEWAVEQVAPLVLDPSVPSAAGVHKPWAYLPPDVVRCILASVRYEDPETGRVFAPTPERLQD
jgi:hypothetical protein